MCTPSDIAIADDNMSCVLLQMEAEVAAVVVALAAAVVALAQLQAMVVAAVVIQLLLLAMAVAVTAMDVSLPALTWVHSDHLCFCFCVIFLLVPLLCSWPAAVPH